MQEIVTLYKYMKLQYVLETLEEQRLYLNDGTNFNDPFEARITNRTNGVARNIKGLHILSLTNSYRKKMMWSHYADSHRGVCLTVKIPKGLVHPLCYTSMRVYENSNIDKILEKGKYFSKKNIEKPSDSLSREKKIAFIKDKKWSQEKEYRIVLDKEDEDDLILDGDKWYFPVKITNVYLGARIDLRSKETEEIVEFCLKNKISIGEMTLSKEKYAIEVLRK